MQGSYISRDVEKQGRDYIRVWYGVTIGIIESKNSVQ